MLRNAGLERSQYPRGVIRSIAGAARGRIATGSSLKGGRVARADSYRGRAGWVPVALVSVLSLACSVSRAEVSAGDPARGYPARPLRFIVPFVPGGGTDITARAIAHRLTERWKQQVIVDNRPGASGNIGMDLAAKATPDGHTLALISITHTINPALHPRLPYDITRDLTGVTQAVAQPYVLVVNPALPATSVSDLAALAKRKPGEITYGSSGTGGVSHLAGALLASTAGIRLLHVPYKGGAAAITEVISGQINLLFSTQLQAAVHIKTGRLRALGVSTRKRSTVFPDVPTIAEAGLPGYEVNGWYGVVVTGGTPAAVVSKLNREVATILHEPAVKARFSADGSETVGNSSEEFGRHIRVEVAKWRKLVKGTGIRAE